MKRSAPARKGKDTERAGLGPVERACLSWSVALATVTGIAYWIMKDLMPRSDPFSVLGHPWQPHALAAHVLIAPVVIFSLGLIAREHIFGGLRKGGRGGNGRSGLATVLLAAPMVASGYLLQVITAPGPRRFAALTHLVTGAVFAACFAAHLVMARRRGRAAAARLSPAPESPARPRAAAP
jgi:hypothetical protein